MSEDKLEKLEEEAAATLRSLRETNELLLETLEQYAEQERQLRMTIKDLSYKIKLMEAEHGKRK